MRGNRRHKMLVARLSALGDVAMTLPAVYSVAREYPDLDVYMLTRPFFSRLFVDAPENLRLLPVDPGKGIKGLWGIFRKLAGIKFDYYADLHNVPRTWLIGVWLRLRGTKTAMVDKMRSTRKALLEGKEVSQPRFLDRYADLFRRLGFPIKGSFKRLEGLPIPPVCPVKPSVGIAPFARYETKTYPIDKMEETVRLLSEAGINVYLFGSKGREAGVLDGWSQKYPGVNSLAGKYSIEEELAMMAGLDAMVSMDSANQHLASLVDVPVITIWGSTTPGCGFEPFSREWRSVCLGLPCQPCSIAGSRKCPLGHLDCLNGIRPETIVREIESIVKR